RTRATGGNRMAIAPPPATAIAPSKVNAADIASSCAISMSAVRLGGSETGLYAKKGKGERAKGKGTREKGKGKRKEILISLFPFAFSLSPSIAEAVESPR